MIYLGIVRHFFLFLDYYFTAQIIVTYRTLHETLIPIPSLPTIPHPPLRPLQKPKLLSRSLNDSLTRPTSCFLLIASRKSRWLPIVCHGEGLFIVLLIPLPKLITSMAESLVLRTRFRHHPHRARVSSTPQGDRCTASPVKTLLV